MTGYAARAAPGQEIEFDAAARQGCRAPGCSATAVPIAAAPSRRASKLLTPQCTDLAGALPAARKPRWCRRADGCPASAADRGRAVGAEPLEARFAGAHRAGAAGVLGQHLADEEHLIAAAGDRLARRPLGAAIAVHLGGVDEVSCRDRGRGEARRPRKPPRLRSPILHVPRPRTGRAPPSGRVIVRMIGSRCWRVPLRVIARFDRDDGPIEMDVRRPDLRSAGFRLSAWFVLKDIVDEER